MLVFLLKANVASAFLDSNLGRWINRDPIGERGGLNLYRYANNNPVNEIDPLGLTVYVYYHPAFPSAFPNDPFNHTAIVLRPDNPSQFANNPLFSATGGQQGTLGGQPDYGSSPFWDPFGDLVGKKNYPGDSPGTGPCASNNHLVPVQPPPGMTDSQFINSLINAANSYGNDQPYWVVPEMDSAPWIQPVYNSNGYTSGVIGATGATPPNLPVRAPGYGVPLPLPYSPPLPLRN